MPSRLHKTESTSGRPTDGVSTNTPCQWRNYSDSPGLPCLLHTGSSWEWQKLQFKPVWGQDPEAQSSSLDHCCSGQRAFAKQVTSSRSFWEGRQSPPLTFSHHRVTPNFQQAWKASPRMCSEGKRSGIFTCKPPVTTILLNFTEQPRLCGKHVA